MATKLNNKEAANGGIDGTHAHAPFFYVRQQRDQAGQIEDIAQALAVRLEHNGKGRMKASHGEQIRRAFALRPKRLAARGVAPRQE